MEHNVAEVLDNPAATLIALHRLPAIADAAHGGLGFVRQGMHLPATRPRHDDEEIVERRQAAQIENDDVFGFVVLRDASTNQGPLLRRRQGCGRKGFEQGSGFQRTSWTSRIYFERSDIQK